MRRPPADCQTRYQCLLRAQTSAQTKPISGAARDQQAHQLPEAATNGHVDDLAVLRRRLAALIAFQSSCQRMVSLSGFASPGMPPEGIVAAQKRCLATA